MLKTYGRTTIYTNYSEKDLAVSVNNPESVVFTRVLSILQNSIPTHSVNKQESLYLKNYLLGKQDILEKVKLTREEINNKLVENRVWEFTDFKKAYLLGKPIQYVEFDNAASDEINNLNKYVRYEDKKAKDLLIYEDCLTVGRGYRYTNKDPESTLDEAPFEIINIDPLMCEVVYSTGLGNEQVLSFIETEYNNPQYYALPENDKRRDELTRTYSVFTVYTKNRYFRISNQDSGFQLVDSKPIILGEHIITEYFLNRDRISMIEIGKDLFDAINRMESLDLDDMEQFVNAIMVFTNATVSKEDIDMIKELGAVSISSTENKKASVEVLQSKLQAMSTDNLYGRLLNSLHSILGVPMSNNSGSVQMGDTGKAQLTGQGYTSTSIRTEADETMFASCDKKVINTILKICKSVNNSGITTLSINNLELRFQRDMSENLLVKTQGLLNLYECDIPRNMANGIVGLFNDPNAVTKEQERIFGEQESKQNPVDAKTDKVDVNTTQEQSNIVQDAIEKDNQGN